MKKRYLLFSLVLLLAACSTSPWDGAQTKTPANKLGEQGCECMNEFLTNQGVDTKLLLETSAAFEADRKKVNEKALTEEEVRAKYPKQFEIAESLPEIMASFPDYPCNREIKDAVAADSLNAEFSNALKEHCLLTPFFKR